jgi:hypothetical protein
MNKTSSMAMLATVILSGLLMAPATYSWGADLGGSPVEPDTAFVARAQNAWSLSFTTYSWLPWLSGDMAVRGRPLSVEASPGDIISALDWSQIPSWMSYAEARNGRLSLFNDIVYSKLSASQNFAKSAAGKFAGLALAGNVAVDYEQATVEFGGAYQIWGGVIPATGTTAVDLLAGGRYWHQKADVSADLNATLNITGPLGIVDLTKSGNRVFARSGSVDWVDPFVGLRVRQQLAPGQEIVVRGDVGGFGVGSDISWQVLATYNARLCVTSGYAIDGYVGYRALSVDYSQGSGNTRYEYNVLQQGPVIGMTTHF